MRPHGHMPLSYVVVVNTSQTRVALNVSHVHTVTVTASDRMTLVSCLDCNASPIVVMPGPPKLVSLLVNWLFKTVSDKLLSPS